MQSGLFIEVLVFQSERLMRVQIDAFILFQTTPAGVVAEPQEVAVFIGHLARDADLVAVEVAVLLSAFAFFNGSVVYLCQGFVGIRVGVEIGISAVPNKAGLLFKTKVV